MCDGGVGLVFASPSRPVPDKRDGQYWPQHEAGDQVTDFRCGQRASEPVDHTAAGWLRGLVLFGLLKAVRR